MTGADSTSARSSHACLFYSNEEEYWDAVTAFISEGLVKGDLVLFIADTPVQEELIARLSHDAVRVIDGLKSGQLMLRTPEETYLRHGDFDPERSITDVLNFSKRAIEQGYRAFRLTGNAEFTCRDIPGSNRLMEYENSINNYLDSITWHSLCQYNLTQLPHGLLLEAIHNHPYVVLGGVTRKNPYYLAVKGGVHENLTPSALLSRMDISSGASARETDLNRQSHAHQSSDTLLSRALQALPGRISIQDRDLHVVYSTSPDRTPTLTGQSASLPYCYHAFMGRDYPCDACPMEVTLETGQNAVGSSPVPHEGSVAEIRTYPLTDHAGQVTHVLEHILPVHHARNTGSSCRMPDHAYEYALKAANSGMFRLDTVLRTLSGDPALLGTVGYPLQEGNTSWGDISDLVHPEDREIFITTSDDLPQNGKGFVCHARLRCASGQWLELEFRGGASVLGPSGNPVIVTGLATDLGMVSPERSALHEAQRKIYLLTTATRHDIANIVTALLAYLNLAEEIVSEDEAGEFLKKGESLAQAVRDQLQFMKDYQELGVRGPMWLDIRDVIMTAAALLEHTLVQFSFSLQPALIFADPMVRKVFSNIFDNAYRHGGHVTRIIVKGYPAGSGYCITVADDGCGIPLEDKEPIFSKGRGKHTGLGLYLCREILSITGISIREKGEPGKGAFFEIQVPSHGYRPLADATGGTTPPTG